MDRVQLARVRRIINQQIQSAVDEDKLSSYTKKDIMMNEVFDELEKAARPIFKKHAKKYAKKPAVVEEALMELIQSIRHNPYEIKGKTPYSKIMDGMDPAKGHPIY